MSKLIKSIQQNNPTGRTANGAVTHETSYNACVDFFGIAGSARNMPKEGLIQMFDGAFSENAEVAVRTLQFVRDVRGGAGERQAFRNVFAYMIEHHLQFAKRVLVKVPEIGRWDDVLVAVGTPLEPEAFELIRAGLNTPETAGLCAKWMPRQGEVAYKLRKAFSMTPKGWRKMLVALSNTVEQKMCAKQWHEIEYGKLPSKAAAMYQNAFKRNDEARYNKYVEGLQKGTEKINAGAIFPHDVVISAQRGNDKVATEQWKALPNYMEESGERILPLVDVSYSMTCHVGGNSNLQCMDVAVAIGLYTAERMGGPYKDHFITFHESPKLLKVKGTTLASRVANIKASDWGGSTNFQSAFDLILKTAVKNNLTQEDLPTMMLVLSDMEFNSAQGYRFRGVQTNFDVVKRKFAKAGYEMPKLVFWNLNGREGNMPVTAHESGTALVSGFSPAILKSILSAKTVTPVDIMLDTVMNPRYDF